MGYSQRAFSETKPTPPHNPSLAIPVTLTRPDSKATVGTGIRENQNCGSDHLYTICLDTGPSKEITYESLDLLVQPTPYSNTASTESAFLDVPRFI